MSPEMRTELAAITPARDFPLNFELFAQQPEYIDVNRGLVQKFSLLLPREFWHVDAATGTGMVPKLILEGLQNIDRKGKIICVDPNVTSLEIARKTTPLSEDVSVEFIEGLGQNLRVLLQGKIPEDGVDGVSMLDAIHEIHGKNNKEMVLSSMANILKPGGILILNSAFTTEGIKPNPKAWGRWKLAAFEILKGRRTKTIDAIEIYSPDEYRKMIEDIGLVIIYEEKKVVNLSWETLKAISHYPEFINGVFRDMIDQDKFSLEEKSDALIKALDGVSSIPRGWWEIIAQKPALA